MNPLKLILLLMACLHPTVCFSADGQGESRGSIQKFQYNEALDVSQKAIGVKLDDFRFLDDAGKSITLAEIQGGKPLVLSLVYTSCYQICPTTTRHLSGVIEKARKALGHDAFSVAVLGFDSRFDTPLAMKYFAKKQGIENAGWYVLSTDEKTVRQLSQQLGFLYFSSPNGFDHIVQATVIDAQGVVYRQVYGEVFDTPLLVEPLKELVLGRPQPNQPLLEGLLQKIRFFCTNYDPASDSYHFDYSLFIGMLIGAMIILFVGVFLVREYSRGRQAR